MNTTGKKLLVTIVLLGGIFSTASAEGISYSSNSRQAISAWRAGYTRVGNISIAIEDEGGDGSFSDEKVLNDVSEFLADQLGVDAGDISVTGAVVTSPDNVRHIGDIDEVTVGAGKEILVTAETAGGDHYKVKGSFSDATGEWKFSIEESSGDGEFSVDPEGNNTQEVRDVTAEEQAEIMDVFGQEAAGVTITCLDGGTTYSYYDAEGNLIGSKEVVLASRGEEITSWYDNAGNQVEPALSSDPESLINNIFETRYLTGDEQAEIREMFGKDADRVTIRSLDGGTTYYYYNDEGNLIGTREVVLASQGEEITTWYDSEGNAISEPASSIDPEGNFPMIEDFTDTEALDQLAGFLAGQLGVDKEDITIVKAVRTNAGMDGSVEIQVTAETSDGEQYTVSGSKVVYPGAEWEFSLEKTSGGSGLDAEEIATVKSIFGVAPATSEVKYQWVTTTINGSSGYSTCYYDENGEYIGKKVVVNTSTGGESVTWIDSNGNTIDPDGGGDSRQKSWMTELGITWQQVEKYYDAHPGTSWTGGSAFFNESTGEYSLPADFWTSIGEDPAGNDSPDWSRVIVSNGGLYWPDASRGNPQPGMAYAQVLTPLTSSEAAEYLGMLSAGEAAEILEGLDAQTAADILSIMDADSAAEIITSMLNTTYQLFALKDIMAALSTESAADILSAMEADDVAGLFQGTLPLGGGTGTVGKLVDAAKAAEILSEMSVEKAVAVLSSDNLSAARAAEILGAVGSSLEWTDSSGNTHYTQTWAINGIRSAEILSGLAAVDADKAAAILGSDNISDGLKVSILCAMDAEGAALIIGSDALSVETAAELLERVSYTDAAHVDDILAAMDSAASDKADSIREALGLEVSGDWWTGMDTGEIAGYLEGLDTGERAEAFVELYEADMEKAVEVLSAMNAEDAALILSDDAVSAETAAEIFGEMDTSFGAKVMDEMDVSKAAAVLDISDVEKAAALLVRMSIEQAAAVISDEAISAESAADIFSSGGLSRRGFHILWQVDDTKAMEIIKAVAEDRFGVRLWKICYKLLHLLFRG